MIDIFKQLFVLILLFLGNNALAQKKLTTNFNYRVSYELNYHLDSTNLETKKTEDVVLFIGNDLSVYSSKAKLFKNEIVVKGNSAYTSKQSITDFPYVIIKNFKKKQLLYTLQIVDDFFYYEQDMTISNWQLHEDTKEIHGYKVQKASTSYAGRDYIAWFTTDIPIADGPFKFNGLPGLILEIYDTLKHYHFTLTNFEKLEPEVPFKISLGQYIVTSKEKMFEVWYRYRRDPFTYVNNPNVKITPEIHQKYIESFTALLERENNRIEKN
jgi:GLPGLI family protein